MLLQDEVESPIALRAAISELILLLDDLGMKEACVEPRDRLTISGHVAKLKWPVPETISVEAAFGETRAYAATRCTLARLLRDRL